MTAFASTPKASGYSTSPQFVAVTTYVNIKAMSAATYSGKLAFATDLGAHGQGAILRSNGTKWKLLSPLKSHVLSAPVTVSNTDVQTEAASFTVPGELVPQTGGVLWIFAHLTFTSSANAKQVTVTINGNTLFNVSGYSGSAGATLLIPVSFLSASSQAVVSGGTAGVGAGGTAVATSVNTSSDYTIKILVKMATGITTETMILKNAYLEVE